MHGMSEEEEEAEAEEGTGEGGAEEVMGVRKSISLRRREREQVRSCGKETG